MDRLAYCAMEASKNHTSYGKYVALNGIPKDIVLPEEEHKGYQKKCPICGKVFYAERNCRKYCSSSCRFQAENIRRAKERKQRSECVSEKA